MIEDVAYRVIAADQRPDHTTIARFRQRHERALAELFSEVLALCADAGLVSVALLAVEGTKLSANASQHANRNYEQIAKEVVADAEAIDRAEDERFGEARGDELPPELATEQGRRGWLREAKRRLEEKRAKEARSIPRSRSVKTRGGCLQGYNAEAAINEHHRLGRPSAARAGRHRRETGGSSSPPPATGTSARWRRSSTAASRF